MCPHGNSHANWIADGRDMFDATVHCKGISLQNVSAHDLYRGA